VPKRDLRDNVEDCLELGDRVRFGVIFGEWCPSVSGGGVGRRVVVESVLGVVDDPLGDRDGPDDVDGLAARRRESVGRVGVGL